MLIILLPLMSLMLFPFTTSYFWPLTILSLVITTISASVLLPSSNLYLSISPLSSMDMMSITLIILTLWIGGLMFMASYKISIKLLKPRLFMWTSLVLVSILVLCFSASNLLHFYVWFEASLIPTMLLILLWGYQPERIQASMYLMIYTVVASLPLLVLTCKIYYLSNHLLMSYPFILFPQNLTSTLSWLLMMTAFLVKLPLFSVHLWLPKAHVEAPIAGSMVLAAILLKLGGYGLIRATLLFPAMVSSLYSMATSIALVGAVLTSLICLRQSDLKSLIAYSSVGHMGLLVAGTLSNSSLGLFGSLAMMIAHGLVSSAMFCMANMSYELFNTRSISLTRGLLACTPLMAMWWFLFICANMAAPPSINLFSEILLITATMSHNLTLAVPLSMISFFTAAYSLYLYSATCHGTPLSSTNMLPSMSPHYSLLTLMHLSPVVILMSLPTSIII